MKAQISTYEELSDTDLIALVGQNNQFAFGILWNRHHKMSLLFARRIVRNEDDALEVVQDAWLNAWRHLAGFKENAKFSSWLIAIVRNLCLMKLRSKRRDRVVPMESRLLERVCASYGQPDAIGNPERALQQAELRRFVRDQISRIPYPYRRCLVAAYFDGSPAGAAAKRLDLTEPTLKARLRRAKASLRQRINRETGFDRTGTRQDLAIQLSASPQPGCQAGNPG